MNNLSSCIYFGKIGHKRFKPKRHIFFYRVFSLLIDLDEINIIDKKIKFFSYNKFNLLSFHNKDHGPRNGDDLKNWVINILDKAKINIENGKIKLLCFPRLFGYVFNPLSIFYCFDEKSNLKAILYEVKNTFNEQHTYLIPVRKNCNLILQKCDKKMYVSPFMEMNTYYSFRLNVPSDKLKVFIKQTDHKECILSAYQVGNKLELNQNNLIKQLIKHPLMTFKIIISIHFEAFRLWKSGVKLVKRKPKKNDTLTIED